jgi:hypothetical protein
MTQSNKRRRENSTADPSPPFAATATGFGMTPKKEAKEKAAERSLVGSLARDDPE